MSSLHNPPQPAPGIQLVRKAAVLKKLQICNSSLHAKLDPKSRYFNKAFPRPIYFPGGRIPYWDLAVLDAFISSHASSTGPAEAVDGISELPPSQPVGHLKSEPKTITMRAKACSDGRDRVITVSVRKPRLPQAISHSTAN